MVESAEYADNRVRVLERLVAASMDLHGLLRELDVMDFESEWPELAAWVRAVRDAKEALYG